MIELDEGAGATGRTPLELINLYWEEVWNNRNAELIREICADPIVRHDPGAATLLSHDEQVARVAQQAQRGLPHFKHRVLVANDEYVTSVWNMVSGVDGSTACGMETFRAEGGRLTDCWNAPYAKGLWGEIGDAPDDSLPAVLEAASAIDCEWVQRVFRVAGVKVPRIAVVEKVEPVGAGTSASTVRIHFAYNADPRDLPETLIAKFPTSDPTMRAASVASGAYRAEVEAYRFLGASASFRIPRCYFADIAEDGRFNLVIEDLGVDARPGDQIAGCSIAEAEATSNELAKLHASYWNDPRIDGLDWLIRHDTMGGWLGEHFREGKGRISDRCGAGISAEAVDMMERATELVAPWFNKSSYRGRTLIHGDARVDNIVFSGAREDPRACLIDFQRMGVGDPMFDLAYFLSGSLSPEDRRSCERGIVERHAAAIARVDSAYSFAQAWDRYRANIIAAHAIFVSAAAVIKATPHNDRLLTALVSRSSAALADLVGLTATRAALAP